jgi:colicin import membrane protein
MGEFMRDYGVPVLVAVLLHVVLFALLLVGLGVPRSATLTTVGDVEVIEAVMIDEELLEAPRRRIAEAEAAAEAARREEQAAERRRVEAAEQVQREEAQREAARREQVERERVQQLAREREQAERGRQEAEAEQRARQEAERRAREEEAAAAQRRVEEERRAREEAERRAREEERRVREAQEARAREQAEARARAEAERRAQAESERRAGEERAREGMLDQYRRLIEQRIVRNWVRPPSAAAGLRCEVNVRQAPGGTILDVTFGACNGDEAVRRSIEAAVYRSSPLPDPPDPTLFQRQVRIIFEPRD